MIAVDRFSKNNANNAKTILNPNQARILETFGQSRYNSIPEIAVQTKLAPSEVRTNIKDLEDRKLLSPVRDNNLFKLTHKGKRLVKTLQKHSSSVFVAY